MSFFKISIFGRTNVGKSTLFNFLIGKNKALVGDISFLTRDLIYEYISVLKNKIILIDTPGILDTFKKNEIEFLMFLRAVKTVKESNFVFLLVDNDKKFLFVDLFLIKILFFFKKKFFLFINNKNQKFNKNESYAYHFFSIGVKNIFFINALNKFKIKDIFKKIDFLNIEGSENLSVDLNIRKFFLLLKTFSKSNKFIEEKFFYEIKKELFTNKVKKCFLDLKSTSNFIKLSVIGKPNVGKSTLVNYLLREDRMLVYKFSGTTRDSICSIFKYNNDSYSIIDTPGIRRRKKIFDNFEKICVKNAIDSIKKVDIVLLVLNALDCVSNQELLLIELILKYGKSLIIIVNKWDCISLKSERKIIQEKIKFRLRHLKFIRIFFVSALYGKGIFKIFNAIKIINRLINKKFKTSFLNKIVKVINQTNLFIFLSRNKKVKIKYIHIGGYNPLLIVLHGKNLENLSRVHRKYLKKVFYKELKIVGIPILIKIK